MDTLHERQWLMSNANALDSSCSVSQKDAPDTPTLTSDRQRRKAAASNDNHMHEVQQTQMASLQASGNVTEPIMLVSEIDAAGN